MEQTAIQYGVPALIIAGTWLWHKIRGEKRQSLAEMLTSVVEHSVLQLANHGMTYDSAQREIEKNIAAWLGDRKMSAPDWMVHEMVAYGMQRLAEEYKERVNPLTLERLLKAITAASSATESKFDPPSPEKRQVPPLQVDITETKP